MSEKIKCDDCKHKEYDGKCQSPCLRCFYYVVGDKDNYEKAEPVADVPVADEGKPVKIDEHNPPELYRHIRGELRFAGGEYWDKFQQGICSKEILLTKLTEAMHTVVEEAIAQTKASARIDGLEGIYPILDIMLNTMHNIGIDEHYLKEIGQEISKFFIKSPELIKFGKE